jgi:hypothetical protein
MTASLFSVDEIPQHGLIFIYGAGSVGQVLARLLSQTRPDVRITFLDSFREGECMGHKILKFANFVPNATMAESIVIASSFWPEIAATLQNAGFRNIRQALSLFELLRDRGVTVRLVPDTGT